MRAGHLQQTLAQQPNWKPGYVGSRRQHPTRLCFPDVACLCSGDEGLLTIIINSIRAVTPTQQNVSLLSGLHPNAQSKQDAEVDRKWSLIGNTDQSLDRLSSVLKFHGETITNGYFAYTTKTEIERQYKFSKLFGTIYCNQQSCATVIANFAATVTETVAAMVCCNARNVRNIGPRSVVAETGCCAARFPARLQLQHATSCRDDYTVHSPY